LRFTEIEDLLGFKLPGIATPTGTGAQPDLGAIYGGAHAKRTAAPNFTAQTVTFTRAFA
jgi:hypothetical protein